MMMTINESCSRGSHMFGFYIWRVRTQRQTAEGVVVDYGHAYGINILWWRWVLEWNTFKEGHK